MVETTSANIYWHHMKIPPRFDNEKNLQQKCKNQKKNKSDKFIFKSQKQNKDSLLDLTCWVDATSKTDNLFKVRTTHFTNLHRYV